ncbi:hypothetical protein [Streptomyces sp. SA15]|uniref:hypothetical protein n=1 Tax=Streptomyces sp. SA15 TaxID=934019 RepID=UPI0015CCE3A5|nr:hypothetical protein [Streptomyces sp. SA15]
MIEPYVIELEPEVRGWLEGLSPQHYRQAEEKELCEAEHGPAHDEFTREFREDL